MQKVWSNLVITLHLPSTFQCVKDVAKQELMSGLIQSLSEVKRLSIATKLVTKHEFFIVVMSLNLTSSNQFKAWLLNVHLRNLNMVVHQRHLMSFSREFWWSLSMCKNRSNVLSPQTKAIILSWWMSETRINPNWKEVVRKWLMPHKYDEKPTHYLMETQVWTFIKILYFKYWIVSLWCKLRIMG